MERLAKSLLIIFLIIAFLLVIECFFPIGAFSETLYVNVSELNGRAMPNKNSHIESCFIRGDTLKPISLKHDWIEVKGGETGTVWCKAKYVSSFNGVRKWKNISGGSVNIREEPSCESRKSGKIKANRIINIIAEVFGWGYIKDQGWVDLSYFEVVGE